MRNDSTVTFSNLLKIAVFAGGVYAILILREAIWLLLLAGLVAIALDPALRKMERGIPRWAAIGLLTFAVGATVVAIGYFIVPPVVDQMARIAEHLPSRLARATEHLPESSYIRTATTYILESPRLKLGNFDVWAPRLFEAGKLAFTALAGLLFVFVFTVYFLIDGPRAWLWFTSFFKPATRRRLQKTSEEIVPVVSAYITGQIITSVLSFLFVFLLLRVLHVPAALTLGVVAGIFDVLPIVGFFLSIIPSIIFALTVSLESALIVGFAYGIYHLFESYVLVPLVYGKRMRLSGVSVLLALIVGNAFGGIVGAIVILPVVASYPIIEKIWLKKKLGTEVVSKHEALQSDCGAVLGVSPHLGV